MATFRSGETSVDQCCRHVVPDESPEKLDQADEHRLERLGDRGITVRRDGLRDAVNVRVRPGPKLNLPHCWVFGPRLRERAREERVTAVRTNPP
jgi:hypothetical protein